MSGPPRSSGWSRLLEDAQIKLSVVAADLFGVSGRQMLEALVTGQRDPKVLAQLAQEGCAPRSATWPRRSPGTSAPTTATYCE
jgi:hypothetical protein